MTTSFRPLSGISLFEFIMNGNHVKNIQSFRPLSGISLFE